MINLIKVYYYLFKLFNNFFNFLFKFKVKMNPFYNGDDLKLESVKFF